MNVVKNGISAFGKLLVVLALTATFMVGLFGVFYVQLKGEEVKIPKIVGKNFNDGREDLADYGLRIRKISSRYSNEDPNTILEQRPRAGSTAKTGLMISVVVSEKNPDGSEAPVGVKDDEKAIEEIESQPELKIDKPKAKTRKTAPRNRDVLTNKPDDEVDGADSAAPKEAGDAPAGQPSNGPPTILSKPPVLKTTPAPKKTPVAKPPKTGGDSRVRKVPEGDGALSR